MYVPNEYFKMFHHRALINFINTLQIKTRPNAGPGVWLMFLLPLALIISVATQPIISTSTHKLSSIFSVGLISTSLLFLHQSSNNKRLKSCSWQLVTASFVVALLFKICLHRGVLFSIWSAIISVILYHKLLWKILEKLPECFTIGEAAISAQSYVLLLYFTFLNIFSNTISTSSSNMQISTLVIQVGMFGISTIIMLAYQFNIKNPPHFYVTTIFVVIFIVLLPLQYLLQQNPLLWLINLFWEDFLTYKITLYWSVCCAIAVAVINLRIKKAKKASTAVRKVFHVLAAAVFLPGLLYNCSFLYLASGVVFGLFFALEILRILNIPPLSHHLQNGLIIFGDEKDTGIIALTPMYLMAGCSLPLWIHPAPCDVTNSAIFNLLPLLSGILTTGIGDTAASIIGSKIGHHHWHGSKKTIEGTMACMFSQIGIIALLINLDFLKFFSFMQYTKTAVAILVTSLIEAKTDQVDNLVLPFVMYIILMLPVQ